jgi:hypothetical protein
MTQLQCTVSYLKDKSPGSHTISYLPGILVIINQEREFKCFRFCSVCYKHVNEFLQYVNV